MIRLGDYITTPEDEEIVLKVLRSNRLSEGRYVREFEEKWADFCGAKYCVLTNSGTSALMAALRVLSDITNERKVLTTPLTFIATINAIVLTGFEPVFSDVERDTFVIKPTINNCDIFLPVHLYGYPVDMDRFNYSFMVEDAAEAHGTMYKGRRAGSIGIMGIFSFYIAHNISVGDMGAVVTSNPTIYKELKKVKAHGRMCECFVCRRNEGLCPHKDANIDPRFTHTKIAYNFKTTEIQAALGLNQIKHAEEIIFKRQENVKYINDGLAGLEGIQLPKHDTSVSYLAYPLILTTWPLSRANFCKRLTEAGIENRPLFPCVPTQTQAYQYMRGTWSDRLPNAEWLGDRGLHLPCHQYLKREELDKIIEAVRECLKYP